MNRRSFIRTLATAAVASAAVPAAVAALGRQQPLVIATPLEGVPIVFDNAVLGSTIRNLFNEQEPVAFYWASGTFTRAEFEDECARYGEPLKQYALETMRANG